MNEEQMNVKECFDAFIEEYKELSLKEKQSRVIKDLKEMIALYESLTEMYKIDYELIYNREILDMEKEDYTQDDFAEAVYCYLQIFKDISSNFVTPLIEDDVEVE